MMMEVFGSFEKYSCQIQITQIWFLSASLKAVCKYMFKKVVKNKIN
jgi:hypothetical protein